jgi:inosose dehydratase
MQVQLGTAPDSWGVWFPSDPRQTDWRRFLDEVALAGYTAIELGPYGYLPTDPRQLRQELDARGLRLSGGTVGGPLHDPARYATLEADALRVAELTAALGAHYLVVLPAAYRDHDDRPLAPRQLSDDGWAHFGEAANRVGSAVKSRFGLQAVFHPHADSHVELEDQVDTFMALTDPAAIALCLDVGHIAYRGGDPIALFERHAARTPYLHLKSVDPAVRQQVLASDPPFATAVQMGVCCEPQRGAIDFPALVEALRRADFDGWAIVEQDLYPCDPETPLPIARRTRAYLNEIGLG